ncbi:Vps5-domain-containing protein [Ramicandelaber brevisporus]|nr:Vps5-domain-containing protein [Ramicandelaber brevisporus]
MNSSDFGGFESDDLGDSSSRGSTRPARPFGFAAIEPEPFNPFADDEPSYSSSRFGHSDGNRGGLAADEHGGWQSRSPTATSPVAATFHSPDVIVRRRYTDFVWLFNQLSATHPGAIVPPLPEKQSLGRFEDEFIESRRAALARFLSSVARHPLFRDHVDFQIFLESDSFGAESAERKRVVDEAVAKAHKQVGAQMTSDGGLFSFFAGALSSTFVPTFVEFDSWFENRRLRVDQLETQLRLFLKAVEGIVVHRRELAGAHQEFGESLQTLAKAEPHLPLAASISALGELQIILKALHDKQADNDTVSLLQTADEHLRTMGSIKLGFQARVKAWQSWEIALNDFGRKRAQHEKAARQAQQTGNYASSNDISRIGRLRSECGILEIDCSKKEDQFELITGRLKSELERFDNLKIEDFCKAIDDSLESMVELQAQVVAQWEKFLSSATANMSNFTAAQRD